MIASGKWIATPLIVAGVSCVAIALYGAAAAKPPPFAVVRIVPQSSPIARQRCAVECVLENRSAGSRRIVGFRSGCLEMGCVAVDGVTKEIAARSQVTVNASISVNKPGSFTIPLHFYTDSDVQPEITIDVVGTASQAGQTDHTP